ncbi:MAG: TonB-dependent receptor plug domain-containing protein [Puniceicoccaceae bacterium]
MCRRFLIWLLGSGVGWTIAGGSLTEIAPFELKVERVANPAPVSSFAAPVSLLIFEPQVDVQSRGFAEAQADVSIRGGTFDQTGFVLGPLALLDPQTGHYFSEIPFSPEFLENPEILTGGENTFASFNSTAGSVRYRPGTLVSGGKVAFAAGNNRYWRAEALVAEVFPVQWGDLGVAVEVAHSESDGTIEDGDHRFDRVSGLLQLVNEAGQTDLLVGYQDKFFGWPNLYAAPFNSPEIEDLETTTIYLGHRQQEVMGGEFEVGTYFRKNVDDYDFDRRRKNQGNPFQHTTEVVGMGFDWGPRRGALRVRTRGEFYADSIESTSLTNSFQSRSYWKLALLPEWLIGEGEDLAWTLRGGGVYADTNRDAGSFEGILEAERVRKTRFGEVTLKAGYSGASQVPGYTAIGSNPNGGLFRGNPDLGRERSDTIEVSAEWTGEKQGAGVTYFFRRDEDLLDWTFRTDATTSRTANPIDASTHGIELIFQTLLWGGGRMTTSYAFLNKSESFQEEADASFYALNYPEHRVTVALIQPLGGGFQMRLDTELRKQRENLLRQSSDRAVLSYLSLSWNPPKLERLTLIASVDNLFGDDFEEVPGTSGAGTQWSFGGELSW